MCNRYDPMLLQILRQDLLRQVISFGVYIASRLIQHKELYMHPCEEQLLPDRRVAAGPDSTVALAGWHHSPQRCSITAYKRTFVKAATMVSSKAAPLGSALRRTLPERMNGSCGISTSLERVVLRGRVV